MSHKLVQVTVILNINAFQAQCVQKQYLFNKLNLMMNISYYDIRFYTSNEMSHFSQNISYFMLIITWISQALDSKGAFSCSFMEL